MKDEIKEILECLKQLTDFKTLVDNGEVKQIFADFFNPHLKIDIKNANILLDYITNLQEYYNDNVNKYEELLVKYSNLQEENERLKEQIEILMSDEDNNVVWLEDYNI